MAEDDLRTSTQMYRFGGMVFKNLHTQAPRMIECLKLAERAADTQLSILITGESGTGKNLLAQAIHNASSRRSKPFITVNTSALSESLLESELFGHEKGAFTGADRRRQGHFEVADGGTLVLDEIGDMSLVAQPKILHAVEYKQFQRVGGEALIHADVRIIASTHYNLSDLVESKRFRHDLLYRLQEIMIELPPLRQRLEDIPLLCDILRKECAHSLSLPTVSISEQAIERMTQHDWPGNIRELKSVIRRAAVLADGAEIRPQHLGLPQAEAVEVAPASTGADLRLSAVEKRHIERVLQLTSGNKSRTADLLDIARTTLDRKISAYEIPLPS